jgi:DNA-binding NarL/FixJ family response regulator
MRVLLADDHALVRHCLRMCLEGVPNIEVVAEAADGVEALDRVRALAPDAVLMDISMPGLSGIEVTRKLVAERTSTRVVALSMHNERELVMASFQSGAVGYVVKSAAYDELVRALDVVASGGLYVSPSVAGFVMDQWIRPAPSSPLSRREREVLRAIAEGGHTKAIADDLGVSDKTVHAIRAKLMRKLHVNSVAELTKCAIRLGLSALE